MMNFYRPNLTLHNLVMGSYVINAQTDFFTRNVMQSFPGQRLRAPVLKFGGSGFEFSWVLFLSSATFLHQKPLHLFFLTRLNLRIGFLAVLPSVSFLYSIKFRKKIPLSASLLPPALPLPQSARVAGICIIFLSLVCGVVLYR